MPVFDCKRRAWSQCQGDKFCHVHWFLIQAQTVLFSICLRHTHQAFICLQGKPIHTDMKQRLTLRASE